MTAPVEAGGKEGKAISGILAMAVGVWRIPPMGGSITKGSRKANQVDFLNVAESVN